MDSWKQFTRLEQISLGHNASELYFETEDLDAFEERLRSMPISYVHPVHQQPWGQRAMRFYDPDGHIIEVGETMPSVVRRFLAQGLTPGGGGPAYGRPAGVPDKRPSGAVDLGGSHSLEHTPILPQKNQTGPGSFWGSFAPRNPALASCEWRYQMHLDKRKYIDCQQWERSCSSGRGNHIPDDAPVSFLNGHKTGNYGKRSQNHVF